MLSKLIVIDLAMYFYKMCTCGSFIEDIFLVIPAFYNGSAERQTLLVPAKFHFTPVSQVIDDEDNFSVIPKYEADDMWL